MMKYYVGDILYTKDEDNNIEYIRIIKIQNKETCVVLDKNGDKYKVKIKDINDYIKLKPDGYLHFLKLNAGNNTDIAVILNRSKDLDDGISEPYLICRQNILDVFANILIIDKNTYVGCTVTKDDCPVGINFKLLLACDGIEDKFSMSIYITDNINNILDYIPRVRSYDDILTNMYEQNENLRIKGYSNYLGFDKTLKDFLKNKEFYKSFYFAFNITPIDIEIKYDEDNKLNRSILNYLENIFKFEMFKGYAIKYNKNINLNDIERNYMLVADSTNTVYIIIYDKGECIYREYKTIDTNINNEGILNINL